MSHQCNHDHKHADKWTNLNAFGAGATGYISNAFWIANLFDDISGLKGTVLPISWAGLAFGLAVSALTTAGATYSHYVLNRNHQNSTGESGALLAHKSKLTVFKKLALAGDFIVHVGEIAGPITFIIALATNNTLDRRAKTLIQCGSILFGGIVSIAPVRTCYQSMLQDSHSPGTSIGLESRF